MDIANSRTLFFIYKLTMTTQTKNNPEAKLLLCYQWRNRLYNKGCNSEHLNDKIRRLQKQTNFKIPDRLGKEKLIENLT